MGIRVLPDPDPLHPVRVEVEIGRKFAEMNALTLLVVRHLLETQGVRVEVDARVTRICCPVLSGVSRAGPSRATPGEARLPRRHALGVPSLPLAAPK